LDTRHAREKLAAKGKPYWRAIERGLHLGYRRLQGKAGTWSTRHYVGNQQYESEVIGVADDLSDADGVAVLDFWQAQTKARERMVQRAHAAAGKTGPLTVAHAMVDYLEFLEGNRRSAHTARSHDRLFIRPELGHLKIDSLTRDQLQRWLTKIASGKIKARTDVDDAKRARRATANRTLTTLRAALNRLYRAGKLASDRAWRSVEPFEGVESARIRYLTVAEARRLINACDPTFRPLVQAALQTGARYGELIRLQVLDFNPDAGTLAIRQSKSGKSRHVVLTDEGLTLFQDLTAGRSGPEPLLRKANGAPFRKNDQDLPMKEAIRRANISPPISFHGLRHTWASLSIMNDVPPMVVAKNLGHANMRMVEKHYGHLAPSYVADAIRAGAPRFGLKPSNVKPIRGRQ
jgi:integrase